MFAKLASFFTICALAAGTGASPVVLIQPNQSLNLWGGFESMRDFDNFYGADNFSGHLRDVTAIHEPGLVCRHVQVQIVQQRLVILKEFAKKVITETICDVETQAFVFDQWHGSLGHFRNDLARVSGREVGYDRLITAHFETLINDNYDHLGFSGFDYGKEYVIPAGNNWDETKSRASVASVDYIAQKLY